LRVWYNFYVSKHKRRDGKALRLKGKKGSQAERGRLAKSVSRTSRLTLVDQMVTSIRDAIATGVYKQGDVLPSLGELARLANVSLRIPRDALARLASEGLVLPRQGFGSVVLGGESKIWKGRVLYIGNLSVDFSPFTNTVASIMRRRFAEIGYLFSRFVVMRGADGSLDLDSLRHELTRGVDLVFVADYDTQVFSCLDEMGIPFLSEGMRKIDAKCCIGFVRIDGRQALREFVADCKSKHVRKVVQVSNRVGVPINAARALRASGITTEEILIPDEQSLCRLENLTKRAMLEFLKVKVSKSDVYYFADDFLTVGAVGALSDRGLRAPDDFRMVTLSNIGFAPVYPRELTRFVVDPSDYANRCADYMLGQLAGGKLSGRVLSPIRYSRGLTF